MEETRWKEKIKPLDENAMEEARAHWMTVGCGDPDCRD